MPLLKIIAIAAAKAAAATATAYLMRNADRMLSDFPAVHNSGRRHRHSQYIN